MSWTADAIIAGSAMVLDATAPRWRKLAFQEARRAVRFRPRLLPAGVAVGIDGDCLGNCNQQASCSPTRYGDLPLESDG
ncbi:MAG: hypothetical protein U5R48_15650 [Gammaproteobacteria bacterium]|nr:hypothetical protein [Gammaproteobacteria bacterium]